MKLCRATLGLPDPPLEEIRVREPMLRCQSGETAKLESHLRPRCKTKEGHLAVRGNSVREWEEFRVSSLSSAAE